MIPSAKFFTIKERFGVLGLYQENGIITIRHIALRKDFQKRGVGTLFLDKAKKYYAHCRMIIETDEEAAGFYLKFGFICHGFKGKHGN